MDMSVRKSLLRGREAYEADVKLNPAYPDGTSRKSWDQLGEVERWSWSKPARPE